MDDDFLNSRIELRSQLRVALALAKELEKQCNKFVLESEHAIAKSKPEVMSVYDDIIYKCKQEK
jgi:hypothetical protein